MSGPLGNQKEKEYLRLDSNNRIPDVPDSKLFASFLSRDFTATEQEKEEAKQIILELIKDTFVNKATLQNYALNTELAKYQPIGNYVIQDELKNYAFKKDLENYQLKGDYATQLDLANYQLKGDYITQSEVALKYQPIGEYALVSDLSRYQLNTPSTPTQVPVVLPITNTPTSIPVPAETILQMKM